jgi:hypothetical protein
MMLITNGKNFEFKKIFGIKTLRVFEPHCEFPGLIYVPDKEYGLSRQLWNGDWDHYEIGCPQLGAQLFEEGFLSYYPVKYLEEIRDFPAIVRNTVKSIQDEQLRRRLNTNSPIILRIWSTVPEFDPNNFMEVKPAKHCILINPLVSDYTAELRMGRNPLKFEDPLSIMNLWRIVKKGFMINAVQEMSNRPVLAKNNRIIIFGENMSVLEVPRSRSSRQPKDKTPARHSFAGSTSTEELKRRDLELEKELRKLKLKGVQTTSQVSHPCYTADTQLEDEESQEGNASPTESDFIVETVVDPQLCTLRKSRKHEEYRKHKKRFKRFKKRSFEPNDFYKKEKRKPKKRFKRSKNNKDSCYKCGKPGHFAKDCKAKETIKSKKVSNEENENLIRMLEIKDTESSENESELSISSSDNSYCSCSSNKSKLGPDISFGCNDTCCKTIGVMTKEEEQEAIYIYICILNHLGLGFQCFTTFTLSDPNFLFHFVADAQPLPPLARASRVSSPLRPSRLRRHYTVSFSTASCM